MPRWEIVLVNWQKYNPPPSSMSVRQRAAEANTLQWVRLQTDWYRDQDLQDSPDAMTLWPRLLALAGRFTPHGHICLTLSHLSREVVMGEPQLRLALKHLRKCGRIRYSTSGGKVAAATTVSGDSHATYPRTHTHIGDLKIDGGTEVRRGGMRAISGATSAFVSGFRVSSESV